MTKQPLLDMALKAAGGTQRKLAERLGVSPTQISKWKSNPQEHMSLEMENKLKALAGLADEHQPEVVAWAGSIDNATGWEALFSVLADIALDNAETVVLSAFDYHKDMGALGRETVETLNAMGITPPLAFPEDLAAFVASYGSDDPETETDFDVLDENPYTVVIQRIYDTFVYASAFFEVFVEELNDDDSDIIDTHMEANLCLMNLAASKIEVDATFAPKFKEFKSEWWQEYRKWMLEIKVFAVRKGLPLRAEIMDLVCQDSDNLRQTIEKETLGLNDLNLHPDIYMNELLVNLRIVHQVLPEILKALKIDKTFKLDTDDFSVREE